MKHQVALVTGSNRGIGLATVQAFLPLGYTTILTSRKPSSGQAAIQGLQGLGDLHYLPLDVDQADSVQVAAQQVQQQFGRLDILINNAAINYDT